MVRNLAIAFILSLTATAGFAQSGFNGKWETDRPDPLTASSTERRSSVQAEFNVEGNKVTGTINLGGLGGNFFVITDGKLVGNQLRFRTTVTVDSRTGENLSEPATTAWTGEMVGENTLRLGHHLELVGSDISKLLPGLVLPADRQAVPAPAPPVLDTKGKQLSGMVIDRAAAFIPGVTITATNVDTDVKVRQVSNESGTYSFPVLQPGTYRVYAELPGFQTQVFSDVRLAAEGQTRIDFTLQIAAPPDGFQTLLHRSK